MARGPRGPAPALHVAGDSVAATPDWIAAVGNTVVQCEALETRHGGGLENPRRLRIFRAFTWGEGSSEVGLPLSIDDNAGLEGVGVHPIMITAPQRGAMLRSGEQRRERRVVRGW